MHEEAEVHEVLKLRASGLGPSGIARQTGVPRSTVRDWVAGRTPKERVDPAVVAPEPLPREYVYLLGMYLGDGCIATHRRGVYRLRIHLDLRYPGIVDECEAAIRAVAAGNRVNRLRRRSHYTGADRETHVELSCYSKRWPGLFPQHGPGRKHTRDILLEPWQMELVRANPRPLVRGLIHSDGCRFINTGRAGWRAPGYAFGNRSKDILGIFIWACELLGVRWTTAPHTVYVSRKADVALLDEFIGPKA